MSKAMTLRLPDEAHEMLRTKAFNERTSITALVLDAITGAWGKPGTLCDERRCWNEPTRAVSISVHSTARLPVSSDRKGRAVADTCKHCGKRIVRTNDWANRPTWTHQPEGASFHDGQHTYCHRTTAEPEGEKR